MSRTDMEGKKIFAPEVVTLYTDSVEQPGSCNQELHQIYQYADVAKICGWRK